MKSFLLIIFTVLLVGCQASLPVQQEAICGCSLYELTEAEQKSAILLADSGDKESMRKLAMYFLEAADRENYYIWNMRLAEAGDKEAQQDMVCWHSSQLRTPDPIKAAELAAKWGIAPEC